MKLNWREDCLDAMCPVCGKAGAKRRVVDALITGKPIAFVRCDTCSTVFSPGDLDPDYDGTEQAEEIVQYYVEHLAAIDTVVDPLFKIDRTAIRSYAEIGCSFGFSLDFAREIFGWTVRGVEPGPLGRAGARLLGLPIEHRTFTEAEPLGGEPVDLLVATEVIEHIREPRGFMRGVVASLAEGGVLVISTPNADAIAPATSNSHLAQILCPGYHLVIYTPQSLARLVAAHGFAHCECRTTATGLVLHASRVPFRYSPDTWTDRAAYRRYLERRLASASVGSVLERGMAYRLIREHAMYAQWDRAVAFTPRLIDVFRAGCGIDLLEPDRTASDTAMLDFGEFAHRYPFNLSGIFYALAMVELLHRHDDSRAVSYFDASVRWADAVDAILRPVGIADAEARVIRWEARINAVHSESRYDPIASVSRVLRLQGELDGESPDALARAKRAVFVELVTRGEHLHAARIAADVTGALCLAPAGSLEREDECRGCYAVGIYALLHLREHAIAREWLVRAVDAMEAEPDNPALRDFGEAARAALVHADVRRTRHRASFGNAEAGRSWRARWRANWRRLAG